MRLALMLALLTAAARDPYLEPTPQDVPSLVAALGDANLRSGAVVALARVGAPAVPALAQALAKGETSRRYWAAFALGEIGPAAAEATPALMRAAAQPDATLRALAVEALGKVGPGARAAVPVLIDRLKDDDSRVRTWSAPALGKIRPTTPEAARALVAALRDETTRQPAAAALVQIGKPAVAVLTESLPDESVRFDVALALRRIDPAAAAQAGVAATTPADLPGLLVAAQAKERSTANRKLALETLAELGREAAPAAARLVDLLEDDAIRADALATLTRIGEPAVPALVGGLRHPHPRAREAAAKALGLIGPSAQAAVANLLDSLKDRDVFVRRQACLSLGAIGPDTEKVVPALIAVLVSNDAEPVRQASVRALLKAGPEAKEPIVAALLQAIKTGNYGVSQAAGMALKQLDPAAAARAGVR